MQDHTEVFRGINHLQAEKGPAVSFPVLAPNLKGIQDAISAGAKEVAVFTTVSETFCKKNVNCTIEQSLERIQEIMNLANKSNVKVRGSVETFFCFVFSII